MRSFHIPPGYWRRFAAGAGFGIFMSHLLYYLNPQIEVSSTKLTLVNLGYGLYCGLLFGSILWGLRLLRRRFLPPEEFRPHGFGIMTLAVWISAAVYWGHYLTLRIYLPSQAVKILKRGTITLGVVAFLLFLLWLVERNASKRLSQALFAAGCTLLLLTGFVLHQARESFLFPSLERLTVTVPADQPVRPIVIIAIEGFAHDWLIELEPERRLPFFHARRDRFFSRIEPFPTTSSRSISASLVTGKLPYRHGITGQYGRTTPLNRDDPYLLLPQGVGFRTWGLLPPVRRELAPLPAGHVPTVWEIFQRVGRRTHLVSWPGLERTPEGGPRPDGSRAWANDDALRTDLEYLSSARALVERERPDLVVVSLEGFARMESTRQLENNALPPPVSTEGEAIRTYLDEIGRAIEQLANAAADGLVLVVSPSAVHPHYAPDDLQSYVQSRLQPHSGEADGFLLIQGSSATAMQAPFAASTTDLVPTVLFAAGLPVSRDLDGRVLTEAFSPELVSRTQFRLIPSWDARELDVRIEPPPVH